MTGFRNKLLGAAVLGAFLTVPASPPVQAQDGSGTPRETSGPSAPDRSPRKREPSVAVPAAPAGTIGSGATGGTTLPAAVPSNAQPGDLDQGTDGAVNPALPSVFAAPGETTPNDLPVGQVAQPKSREQVLIEQGGMTPGGVEVVDLGEVDPSETGTLAEAEGGLGSDLWSASDYATIAELMAEMPVATASPAMNDLVRRVLLTGAKPRDPNRDGPTLFDIRAARLADAGLTADLTLLFERAGATARDSQQARAEALLMMGQDAQACGSVAESTATDTPAIQLRTLCQLVDGNPAAAALNADLLRVKGLDDPAFFTLVAHLADGAPVDAASLRALTPVSFALARRGKVKLTAAAMEGSSPGVAAALARDPATAQDLRLGAAERAGAGGALPATDVIAIFRAAKLGKAKREGASEGAALLQAAISTEGLAPRATAIATALSFADGRNLSAFYAQLLARAAWETAPSAETAAHAGAVTRILFLSGRADRAADWTTVAAAKDELTVQLALGAPTPQRLTAATEALERLASAPADDAVQLRTLIYAGALEALGQPIPPAATGLLASSPLMAAPPVGAVETAELADAARANRKGEAIIRSLIVLGQGGPASAHPAVVIEAVAALSRVGLNREAAAIALEAALARPLLRTTTSGG
jgi:hypothetical protein